MNYQTAFCWKGGEKGTERAGRARTGNEDSLLLQQIRSRRGRMLLILVSDGIGGMAEGENASGLLAEEMKNWFYGEALDIAVGVRRKAALWLLERSASRQMYRMAKKMKDHAARRGCHLGATLTWMLVLKDRWLLCSVGDSRACRIDGKGYRWLTRDDADSRGRLLRCMGSMGWYPARFSKGRLRKGQLFLLCTDGFWKRLLPEDLAETTGIDGEEALGQWLERTEKKLRKRGERDDMSAIIMKGEKDGCQRRDMRWRRKVMG